MATERSRHKETLQLALVADYTYALPFAGDQPLRQSLTMDVDHWRWTYRSCLCLPTMLQEVQEDLRFTCDTVLQTRKEVQETGKVTIEVHQDSQREKIYRWLSAPDPSTNYIRAHRSRHHHMGLWFLQGAFNEWTKKAQLMWLHGKAGCGKTVLSSTIINKVFEACFVDGVAVAYFYFDFNDDEKQKSDKMICSIIKQFYALSKKKSHRLKSLFSSCNDGQQQPSRNDLIQVLKELMKEFHNTYIILDALDECSDREELLECIEKIQTLRLSELRMLTIS